MPGDSLLMGKINMSYLWPANYQQLELPAPWFFFEAENPHRVIKQWTVDNRYLSIIFGLAYLVALFAGRRMMENRKPFSLRGVLAAWNIFMALFSIAVTLRVGPFFLQRVLNLPLHAQVCFTDYERRLSVTLSFWHDLFVLSKPMEFVDTIFIILRKQHLHFLHYYHHITVVVLCWYSLGTPEISPPNSIFYVGMNGFVHSVMYIYYCLRSARVAVPRQFQMSITTLQITQMVVGTFINMAALYYRLIGSPCDAQYESILLALAIYGSYFYLFSDFFRKTYLGKGQRIGSTSVPVTPVKERHQPVKVD